jgi:hypothetical protein
MSDTLTPEAGGGTGLAEPGARFAAQLAAAVIRRIEVPSFVSMSGQAASIRIGEISLGEANIDQIDVFDLQTRFSTGNIFLSDARALVEIRVVLHWWWDVWPFSDSGDVTLGTVDFPFPIGDVGIPALSNIRLEVPTATLDDVRATLQPVTNLDLGGGTFENLRVADTLVPSAGFGLGGLGLGAVRLNQVAVPAVSAASLRLGRFAPSAPLALPSLRVEGIELPAASVPRVESEGLILVRDVTSSPWQSPSFGFGPAGIRVRLEPKFHMFIERMVIQNLTASASVETIQVRNISAPAALRDVRLDGLQLEQLTIERITV